MNRELVKRIADTVLYEGYILYPYRPSVKNRQRWTFGGLYPKSYTDAQGGSDAWSNQTECLIHGTTDTPLTATVRFLHLTSRIAGEIAPPLADWPAEGEPLYRPVETLQIGDRVFSSWQEAEAREIEVEPMPLGELLSGRRATTFTLPGKRWLEPLRGPVGDIAGVLVRDQWPLRGAIEIEAGQCAEKLFKVTVRIANRTPLDDAEHKSRDDALLRSLISTHTILGVSQGEFISLLDPPEFCREAAAACCNICAWPVLVGEEGEKDTMLSAPIILYDYPQIAAESPGDLFDSTEIDEILTLRILTMTEEEKQAAAAVDERAKEMLARTESLAREQLARLHGTIRGMRPSSKEIVDG